MAVDRHSFCASLCLASLIYVLVRMHVGNASAALLECKLLSNKIVPVHALVRGGHAQFWPIIVL